MKITVEIPDSDMKEICRVTGEKKNGSAIRKLVKETLRLKRRAELAEKFIGGEWGVQLKGFSAPHAGDGHQDTAREKAE